MSSTSIVIRRENPDQPGVRSLLAALDAYLASLYPPEANHVLDIQALQDRDVHFFVAREQGLIVGTAAVRLMPGEDATGGERYGEIKRMYVEPARRGKRIGAALIDTLEVTVRAQGQPLVLLETGRHQHEAVRLYERCGYRPRSAFGGYPDNGLSAFYEKRL